MTNSVTVHPQWRVLSFHHLLEPDSAHVLLAATVFGHTQSARRCGYELCSTGLSSTAGHHHRSRLSPTPAALSIRPALPAPAVQTSTQKMSDTAIGKRPAPPASSGPQRTIRPPTQKPEPLIPRPETRKPEPLITRRIRKPEPLVTHPDSRKPEPLITPRRSAEARSARDPSTRLGSPRYCNRLSTRRTNAPAPKIAMKKGKRGKSGITAAKRAMPAEGRRISVPMARKAHIRRALRRQPGRQGSCPGGAARVNQATQVNERAAAEQQS